MLVSLPTINDARLTLRTVERNPMGLAQPIEPVLPALLHRGLVISAS